MKARLLVSRDRWVDCARPRIDAPLEIVHALEPLLFEEQRHLHAAPAVMADRDHLACRVDLGDARRHLAHRKELRACNARPLVLPRLAHIEQHGLLAARVVQPLPQLGRHDLAHQKRNCGGRSALTSGAMTVSKRSALRQAPGALQMTRRARIAGGSPTTANRRPPGTSWSKKALGSSGVEPVSTIAS